MRMANIIASTFKKILFFSAEMSGASVLFMILSIHILFSNFLNMTMVKPTNKSLLLSYTKEIFMYTDVLIDTIYDSFVEI